MTKWAVVALVACVGCGGSGEYVESPPVYVPATGSTGSAPAVTGGAAGEPGGGGSAGGEAPEEGGSGGVEEVPATGGAVVAPVCESGRQVTCPCPGGADGVQACRADGSGWDACVCPPDSCEDGLTLCGYSCVDVINDSMNCGDCEVVCLMGHECSGRECVCPPGTIETQYWIDPEAGTRVEVCEEPS